MFTIFVPTATRFWQLAATVAYALGIIGVLLAQVQHAAASIPSSSVARVVGTAPVFSGPLTLGFIRDPEAVNACPSVCFSPPTGPAVLWTARDVHALLSPTSQDPLSPHPHNAIDVARACFDNVTTTPAANASACGGLCSSERATCPSQCFFDGSQTPRFHDNRTALAALGNSTALEDRILAAFTQLRGSYDAIEAAANLVESTESAVQDHGSTTAAVHASITAIGARVRGLAQAAGTQRHLLTALTTEALLRCPSSSAVTLFRDGMTRATFNINLAHPLWEVHASRGERLADLHATILCATGLAAAEAAASFASFTEPLLNAANLSDPATLRSAVSLATSRVSEAAETSRTSFADHKQAMIAAVPANASAWVAAYMQCMTSYADAWLSEPLPASSSGSTASRCLLAAAREIADDFSAATRSRTMSSDSESHLVWSVNRTTLAFGTHTNATKSFGAHLVRDDTIGLVFLGLSDSPTDLLDAVTFKLNGTGDAARTTTTATAEPPDANFAASPQPFFAPASGLCPAGTVRIREAATGLFQCRECRNEAPAYPFCPGDNVQHLCYTAPAEGARYIAQGPRYSSPECPFLCTSPLHRRSAADACEFPPVAHFPINGTAAIGRCAVPTVLELTTAPVTTVLGSPLRWMSSGVRGDNSSCAPRLRYRIAVPSGTRRQVASRLCRVGFHLRATVTAPLRTAGGNSSWLGLVSVGTLRIAANASDTADAPLVLHGAHLLVRATAAGPVLRFVAPDLFPTEASISSAVTSFNNAIAHTFAVSVDLRTQLVTFLAGPSGERLTPIGSPSAFRGSVFMAGPLCRPDDGEQPTAMVAGGWHGWLAAPDGTALAVSTLHGDVAAFTAAPGPLLRSDLDFARRWPPLGPPSAPVVAAPRCPWGFYWTSGSLGSAAACRPCPPGFAGSDEPRESVADCRCAPGFVRQSPGSTACELGLAPAAEPSVAVLATSQVTVDDVPTALRVRADWRKAVGIASSVPHVALRSTAANVSVIARFDPPSQAHILNVSVVTRCVGDMTGDVPGVLRVAESLDGSVRVEVADNFSQMLPPEPTHCRIEAHTVGSWRREPSAPTMRVTVGIVPAATPLRLSNLFPVPGTAAYAIPWNGTTPVGAALSQGGLWMLVANYNLHPSLAAVALADPWEVQALSRIVNTTRLEVQSVPTATVDAARALAAAAAPSGAFPSGARWSAQGSLTFAPLHAAPYEPGAAAIVSILRITSPDGLLPAPPLVVWYSVYDPNAPPTASPTTPSPWQTPAPGGVSQNAHANATSTAPAIVVFFAHPATIAVGAIVCCMLIAVLAAMCYMRRRRTMRRLKARAARDAASPGESMPPDASWWDSQRSDDFDGMGRSGEAYRRADGTTMASGRSPYDHHFPQPSPFSSLRKRRVSPTPPPTHRAITSGAPGHSPYNESIAWEKPGRDARSTSPRRLLEAASRAEPPAHLRDGYTSGIGATGRDGIVRSRSQSLRQSPRHMPSTGPTTVDVGSTSHRAHLGGRLGTRSASPAPRVPPPAAAGSPQQNVASPRMSHRERLRRRLEELRPESIQVATDDSSVHRHENLRARSPGRMSRQHPSHSAYDGAATALGSQSPARSPIASARASPQNRRSPARPVSVSADIRDDDSRLWAESETTEASRRALPSHSPRLSPTISASSRRQSNNNWQ